MDVRFLKPSYNLLQQQLKLLIRTFETKQALFTLNVIALRSLLFMFLFFHLTAAVKGENKLYYVNKVAYLCRHCVLFTAVCVRHYKSNSIDRTL